jgi:hypothetical protein
VKPKASWIIVAIVLVALLSLDVASREQRTPKTWEYKVVLLSSGASVMQAQAQSQQLLNQQGSARSEHGINFLRPHEMKGFSLIFITALVAVAQSPDTLKQKYGSPNANGLYTVRPGIGLELTSDRVGQPKAMTIKPLETESSTPRSSQKTGMKVMPKNTALEILDEVLPATQRGKKIAAFSAEYGCTSVDQDQYENITIDIVNRCDQQGGGTYSVNIRWKR